MSITTITIHRVEVTIDARAWELFGHTTEGAFEIEQATRGNLTGGYYPDMGTLVWAEYATYADARRCEHKLLELRQRWLQKAQEYDAAASSEWASANQ